MNDRGRQSPASRSLMLGLSSMYAYIYCLLVSSELTSIPIFGGAMYLCGQVVKEFFGMAVGPGASLMPKPLRKWSRVILILLMLLSMVLIVIYPLRLSSFQLWTVVVLVLAMLVRDEAGRRLLHMRRSGSLRPSWFIVLLGVSHVLPALCVLWDFLYNLPGGHAWNLFWGYIIADGLVLYVQVRDALQGRDEIISGHDVEMMEQILPQMEKTNAVKQFQALTIAIVASLSATLVTMYTALIFKGSSNMLLQLGITAGLTLLTREAAQMVFRFWMKQRKRRPNPTYVMLLGFLLWFEGISIFGQSMTGSVLRMEISLCIATVGVTLCMIALQWMENGMQNVAKFTMEGNMSAFQLSRAWNVKMGRVIGDMLSLLLITLLFTFSGPSATDIRSLLDHMYPLVLVPTMIVVLTAVIFTFRFPLSRRHMDKLDRFLHLREKGVENRALKSQLESIAVAEYRQPFGTAFIKAAIRLFYPHKISGEENIHLDDDNPLVFLCNHGEIYGPVICAAYFPVPMRPWVISQVCTEVDVFEAYYCKYTLARAKIPESWKHPVARFVGHLAIWCMRQLEGIPVYRDSPMELIKTFRLSVEAMQAGDNILIFPENPNAIEQDHGYEGTGLGPMFEGFSMLATMYSKRAHKPTRFLPMFAHKGTRTLCFGHEVNFDPTKDDAAERHRVVMECEKEMRRLYEEQEEILKKKKTARKA